MAGMNEENSPDKISFFFVQADRLRTATKMLPCFQELQRKGWLVRRQIDLQKACDRSYVKEYLSVSHRYAAICSDKQRLMTAACRAHPRDYVLRVRRWITRDDPDPKGEQFEQIQHYCQLNKDIKFVWFDVRIR